MNVHKTGSQTFQVPKGGNRFQSQGEIGSSSGIHPKEAAVTETKPAIQESHQLPGQEKVKGVVRLLQEGHFKGVADIRLRINFNEQLQGIATEKAGDTLTAESQALLTALDEKLQAITMEYGFSDQSAELVSNFTDTVNAMIGGEQADGFDPTVTISGIREEFLGLVDSLIMLEQPETTNEEVADATVGDSLDEIVVGSTEAETVATDGVTVAEDNLSEDVAEQIPAQSEYSTAVQTLQEWFEAELVSMEASVQQASSLPPLSMSSGNGVAYNKFLEIYNELNGISKNTADSDTAAETGPIIETEI